MIDDDRELKRKLPKITQSELSTALVIRTIPDGTSISIYNGNIFRIHTFSGKKNM